jgi:hypothetical protein
MPQVNEALPSRPNIVISAGLSGGHAVFALGQIERDYVMYCLPIEAHPVGAAMHRL